MKMSSQLEQELNEEEQPGKMEKFRHRPKPCPRHCPIFECVVGVDGCKEECGNLEMVKGFICDLCTNEATCSKKRRMALLDLEYFNSVKKLQQDDSMGRIEELKSQHRHFELSYKKLKEEAIGISIFSFGKRPAILAKGMYYRNKIELYREVMDILDITYKVDVKLEELSEEPSVLRKNWLWIVSLIVLLSIYLGVTIL